MEDKMPVSPNETDSSAEARRWAMFTHLAAFSVFLMPFGNIVGPLVMWQLKKEESSFLNHHGKEAVNFQITMAIAGLVCFMMLFVVVGAVLLPFLGLVWLVLTLIASVKANNGLAYRYPFTIRFIK